MINYEVDSAILEQFVPAGTELDSWQGRTFVSVVGFMFLKTRVMGLAIPFHRNFEEVNLRFYVRRRAGREWRRGVTFIKEIVPRRAIASVARRVYNENYVALPMRHRIEMDIGGSKKGGLVEYGWKHQGVWNRLRVVTRGGPEALGSGSEEEFITEHYWGYARQKDGSTFEYRVEHPPWLVWQVSECMLDCDVASLYGSRFSERLSAPPSSAFLAEGSAISVRRATRI
jgi:uncharacterized protein YqjF (DUF2071 family)